MNPIGPVGWGRGAVVGRECEETPVVLVMSELAGMPRPGHGRSLQSTPPSANSQEMGPQPHSHRDQNPADACMPPWGFPPPQSNPAERPQLATGTSGLQDWGTTNGFTLHSSGIGGQQ